mmetsp:Transcript_6274/g.23584  ORF Transcript_6274/g.23584 Transcript_6274/m.23584 type:complete len:239 (-) Transcript_6274:487-1203(-)
MQRYHITLNLPMPWATHSPTKVRTRDVVTLEDEGDEAEEERPATRRRTTQRDTAGTSQPTGCCLAAAAGRNDTFHSGDITKAPLAVNVKVGDQCVHVCSHKHFGFNDHIVGLLNHFPAPPNGYEDSTTANVALCSSGTDCVVCDASNNVPRTCDETITVTYVPSTRAKKNKERIVLYRFCCVDCMKRTLGQLSVGDKLKKDRDIAYKKKDQNESSTYIVRNWSTGDARRARLTAALDE